MQLVINKNKCPQNHPCPAVRVCPKAAISQKTWHSLPEIDYGKCISCGKCIYYCPMGAFEKKES